MKSILYVFVVGLTLSACALLKGDVNEKFTATIDGKSFEALAITGVSSSKIITINGTSFNQNLSVVVDVDITEGQHPMDSITIVQAGYTDGTSAYGFVLSGSLTVDKNDSKDKILEGSFNCTLLNLQDRTKSIEIKDAKFVGSYDDI